MTEQVASSTPVPATVEVVDAAVELVDDDPAEVEVLALVRSVALEQAAAIRPSATAAQARGRRPGGGRMVGSSAVGVHESSMSVQGEGELGRSGSSL